MNPEDIQTLIDYAHNCTVHGPQKLTEWEANIRVLLIKLLDSYFDVCNELRK